MIGLIQLVTIVTHVPNMYPSGHIPLKVPNLERVFDACAFG